MNDVAKGPWANAYSDGEFVYIETVSGYRGGTHSDPKGAEHNLDSLTRDDALGSAVLDVVITTDSTSAEIGAALRLAFGRCTD